MSEGGSIDARWRVAYLAAAVGLCAVRPVGVVAAITVVHAALWMAVGLGARRLLRQATRLAAFAAFVIVSYAITADDPTTDQWVPFHVGSLHISLNLGGALIGLRMVLRITGLVLASQVARAGDARAVAAGLARLGVPQAIAAPLDTVLALLDGGGRGGGGGGGGGGRGGGRGRAHREEGAAVEEGVLATLRRIARGDVGPLVHRMDRQIARATRHGASVGLPSRGESFARDVAVISGVSLTMLGIKALKVLPSVPFAPGNKLVLLTPLYVAARMLTRTRLGGTLTGLTMGTVAFLLGDGRYGVFEVLKHVAPGVVCDLLVPGMTAPGRARGAAAWALFGGLVGAVRFGAILGVVVAVQPPAIAYAMLAPGFAVHTGFGVLSGFVCAQFARAVNDLRKDGEAIEHADNR